MVASTLVGPNIRDTERLLAELDRERMPLVAVFWCYPTAADEWRLIIASPLVDREGALPVYRRLQGALDHLPNVALSVSEIFAVGEDDPIVRFLRQLPEAFRDGFSVSINSSVPTSGASYLPEEPTAVTVYPQRVVSTTDAGTATEQASVTAEVSAGDGGTVSEQAQVRRSEAP